MATSTDHLLELDADQARRARRPGQVPAYFALRDLDPEHRARVAPACVDVVDRLNEQGRNDHGAEWGLDAAPCVLDGVGCRRCVDATRSALPIPDLADVTPARVRRAATLIDLALTMWAPADADSPHARARALLIDARDALTQPQQETTE